MEAGSGGLHPQQQKGLGPGLGSNRGLTEAANRGYLCASSILATAECAASRTEGQHPTLLRLAFQEGLRDGREQGKTLQRTIGAVQ